ncbi:IclR family transcriptional regulator domain-containing protein [Variovorax sp. RHLX14]|uniref:IclR family transcriptional regulator domain-containing protein n=1 Tax=Variovorax sp. RHLX14 TaxID=1259731 RepID=UPI003F44B591
MAGSTPFQIDPRDLIAGLGRGLAIIEAFNGSERLTPTEAAARTGIPRTAARRYLESLCHFKYAQTDGKYYWLTPRILRIGQSYLGTARLPRLVKPFIQRLSMSTGEAVNVCVLDDHDVLYIARSASPRMVPIGYQAGDRVPAHAVTPGYVLLSALTRPALERWTGAHDFATHSGSAAVDAAQLIESVRAAHTLGYWVVAGLLDPGLGGVSVPLVDQRGLTVAALSMTLQVSQWPQDRIVDTLVPALRDTAQLLNASLA